MKTGGMNAVIENIRRQLRKSGDKKTRVNAQNFFKEKVIHYGVKSASVGRIANEFFKTVKDKSKAEIFGLCEELWRSGYMEESFIACDWSYRVHKDYEPEDFGVFERWVNKYVGNWASCDTFCNHTVGAFAEMYQECLAGLKKWARSKNRWMRRASAVSLIIPARRGKFLKDILEIADILLLDRDDMVQKGYGWMLKAASQAHQREVFGYVMKNKEVMPRTALRYAVEKMPQELKEKAMQK
jgi:3-methyladenine DNA glycosylase AlkD